MPVRLGLGPFAALSVALSLVPAAWAVAPAVPVPTPGVWRIVGEACPIAFEIPDAEHVVRSTGSLRYTTRAVYHPGPVSDSWVLDEVLESSNGGKSCRGEPIERVREHLARRTTIRLLGDTLFVDGGGGHLQMRRDGTSPESTDFATREAVGKRVLATPAGEAYESGLGPYIQAAMHACVPPGPTAPANLGAFTVVSLIGPSGRPSSIEARPVTRVSRCFSEYLSGQNLPSPPAGTWGDTYPLTLEMKVVE